jgi:tetratricopeptide (TPR) repeat protein
MSGIAAMNVINRYLSPSTISRSYDRRITSIALVRRGGSLFESENKLRHLPFFEEVASHAEGEPQWRSAMAGLVALRLVDAWLEDGPAVTTDDGWGFRGVRSAIEDVDEGTPIRAILGRIVDALKEQKPDIHVVVTPLMAYGQSLEYEAKWTLAADVYQTVLAHLHPVEDSDASIAAHLRLGSCYRNLSLIDDAVEAFASASEIANAVGDIVGILRARIGEAKIATLRGNLPEAATILDDTIARATTADLRDVRSRALHDRSGVATLSGQYELGVRLAYEALEHSSSPTERDRILGDIAGAFIYLGVFSAARDAYLVLSVTAQEQYIRWGATLNLLEIASETGAEMLFEQYRRQLVSQSLPPYLATSFELNLGNGYQRFGNSGKARLHLERAMAMATEHGLNQYLFEAEEALYQIDTPMPRRRVAEEVSLDVDEVASAIRELRVSVGVS